MAKRVSNNIAEMKQEALERGDRALPLAVSALATLEQRTGALSAELDCLRRMSESRVDVDWVRLLDDIKDAVPGVLCITELSLDDASAVRIKGVSKSYEGVDTFVQMLNRSDQIRRAALVQKGRATPDHTDVRYIVKCSLASREMR
jgi:Tfp pilus assembly protein PilN